MPAPRKDGLTRRAVLRATGGSAAGLAVVGTVQAGEHDDGDGRGRDDEHGDGHDEGCGYATASMHHGGGDQDRLQQTLCPDHPHARTGPSHTMKHFDAAVGGCPDGTGLGGGCTEENWPECTDWPDPTIELIEESRKALQETYNDVGTLIAMGYIPYFDVARPGADVPGYDGYDDGVSHWLNPEFIGNDNPKPDPWRPESVMMENKYWSPIGPMFIGADEGELVHDVDTLWGYTDEIREDDVDYDDGIEGNDDQEVVWHTGYDGPTEAEALENEPCGPCHPMHGHDGMPGRFAWWYYRQVHQSDYASGDPEDLTLPCYTAPMLHAWIYPTSHGPHSSTSGAPTKEYRAGRTPNRPGYPTTATPGEDELSYEVLPDEVVERAMPDWLREELHVVAGLDRETLATTPVAELETIVESRTDGGPPA